MNEVEYTPMLETFFRVVRTKGHGCYVICCIKDVEFCSAKTIREFVLHYGGLRVTVGRVIVLARLVFAKTMWGDRFYFRVLVQYLNP